MLNQSSLSSIFSNITFLSHTSSAVPFFFLLSLSLQEMLSAEVTWIKQGWAFLCLSGQGYVRLGMTGSAPTRSSAAPMALSLTQPYFMPDPAKRKIMSVAAHLCLMFSAYAGSPSAEGAAVKSI